MAHTTAEQIIVCMSRTLRSGDTVGLGIGTAMPAAAALLAARTHARELYLYMPGAGAFCLGFPRVAMTVMDFLAVPAAVRMAELSEVLTEGLEMAHKGFFRPAQIDAYGNFNATVIGDYARPKLRLPGAAGIPDVVAVYAEMYFYVTRHSLQTFVPRVDFISGPGHLPGRDLAERRRRGILGQGPTRLISDLGVFGFDDQGRMAVLSLHAGVTWETVTERTGFPLERPDRIAVTEPPTAAELQLLREELDPLGCRDLEVLGGKERLERLRELYYREPELLGG